MLSTLFSRPSLRLIISTAALAIGARATSAHAQELGAYVGGGIGGIQDVRRPFGGGVTGTLLFHDWIGVRADAGYYWTLEHRQGLYCLQPLANEPKPNCSLARIASSSHFPLIDGLAVLRAHIPNKGVRFEVGGGPTWVNVATHLRTTSANLPPTDVSSSRAGAMLMAGLMAHPDWKIPVTVEGVYAYHMTAAFGDCSATRPNDPLCAQHLNFHELRFSLMYRPK